MEIYRSYYRILNLDVFLDTDSAEFVQLFERDYGWFRTRSTSGNPGLSCSVRVRGEPESTFVLINHQNHSLNGHPAPLSCALQIVVRSLFEEIRGFLLLHAGVAAREGRAVMLAGPPGLGKTTLVLKLLESGFSFFSDDVCPVNWTTRLVHPFPRSLWIEPPEEAARAGTALSRVLPHESLSPNPGYGIEQDNPSPSSAGHGRPYVPRETMLRGRKVPIRTRELHTPVGKGPCSADCLICLDPGKDPEPGCVVEVGLKPDMGDALLEDLATLDADITVERLRRGPSEWRIRYPRDRGLASVMHRLLKKHERALWNVHRTDDIRPDFSQEPNLNPISRHEAAFLILRDLKQGLPLQEDNGFPPVMPGRLLMQACEVLEKTRCYRMTLGRLERMRTLVLKAFRNGDGK